MTDDRTSSIGPDDDHTLPLGPAGGAAAGRGRRHRDRPLPPAAPHRRGRHGRGLRGRADRADPPARRPEGHQAGHGHPRRGRPLRRRAPGPGPDGPPLHRQGLRRRRHRRAAVPTSSWSTSRASRSPTTATAAAWARDARLELFVRVCEGVQHAHQKAVIHRDLKPSNILVAEVDGRPVPKIIDFGVAKATTQRLTEMTMFTELGQLIGTPEYMSPEQASLTDDDIDTRTDVYALGVVLYELLAGALPFESRDAAQGRLRGDPQDHPRAGPAAAEHAVQRPRRAGDERGRSPRQRAEAAAERAARRPGLDHDEGAGEGPRPALRDGQRAGGRRAAPPAERAGERRTAERLATASASWCGATARTFAALGAIAVVLVVGRGGQLGDVRARRAGFAPGAAARPARPRRCRASWGTCSAAWDRTWPRDATRRCCARSSTRPPSASARNWRTSPRWRRRCGCSSGYTYRQLGEYDAAQGQIDRVRELQAAFDHASPFPAKFLVEAGSLAWNRGEMKEAEATYRQALAAHGGHGAGSIRSPGPRPPSTWRTCCRSRATTARPTR